MKHRGIVKICWVESKLTVAKQFLSLLRQYHYPDIGPGILNPELNESKTLSLGLKTSQMSALSPLHRAWI